MKKFALGMLAAVAMTGSAVAADMAPRYAKAPPPAPVVVYNWTGCYIGGNIGGGWARTSQERTEVIGVGLVVPPTNYGSSDGSDFVGGAQIGCDYQFAGNWVLGIQGMYNYARIDSSHFLTAFPTFRSDVVTKDIFTVTGRLGYLFTPQLLGYIKGGGAWTRSDYEIFQPGGVLVSENALTASTAAAGPSAAASNGCSLRAGRCSANTTTWTSVTRTSRLRRARHRGHSPTVSARSWKFPRHWLA